MSSSIVGVTRLHGFRMLGLSTRRAVAYDPDPRRHISLDVGRRNVPLTTLKLCKVWIMLMKSVPRRTLSGSEMRFRNLSLSFLSGDQASV